MPDNAAAPVLLHAPEASRITGIPTARLYSLARAGLVPHTRLGRSVRFDCDALIAFLRNGGRAYPGGWRRQPKAATQAA